MSITRIVTGYSYVCVSTIVVTQFYDDLLLFSFTAPSIQSVPYNNPISVSLYLEVVNNHSVHPGAGRGNDVQ